ncbi:putative calcium-binding protein CML48 [Sesamum angolense]|uniref:Calcium-binding protein CML48 n=1 Tax=Sesamum angolense TaxID=2727404 RepID=A0AAE2C4V0_9LAMI|nr:putative calcium-binding protein CML48 [Sesamum angolense]
MASSYTGSPTQKYSPSAPPAPDPDQPRVAYPYQPHAPPSNPSLPYAQITPLRAPAPAAVRTGGSDSTASMGTIRIISSRSSKYTVLFPPGTHPDVIRSFQMVDRNQNGYIEERELQEALTWNYQKFSLRTLRLLIFLFRSSNESSCRIGPKEFAGVWSCLGQWRWTQGELSFDSFVECGMIVKGLTEKFKEKDPRYTGSATLSYDTFMSMIIPFIVSD